MTKREAVILLSRAFAVSFLLSALFDLTYLPERLYSVSYHDTVRNVLSSDRYFHNAALLAAFLLCARIIANLALSAWFFRSGPAIQRLLLGEEMGSKN